MSYDHEAHERRWIATALNCDPDEITVSHYRHRTGQHSAGPWVTIHIGNGHYGAATVDDAVSVAAHDRGMADEPDADRSWGRSSLHPDDPDWDDDAVVAILTTHPADLRCSSPPCNAPPEATSTP